MKKQTVFVTLTGNLGDYVEKIYTQSSSSDNAIVLLQRKLNATISMMSKLPATAENCKALWNKLTELVHNAGVVHTEYEAYKEIINAVDEIGNNIAYLVPRLGIEKPHSIAERVVEDGYEFKINEGGVTDFSHFHLKYEGYELVEMYKWHYLWMVFKGQIEYDEDILYAINEKILEVAETYQQFVDKQLIKGFEKKYNTKVMLEDYKSYFKVVDEKYFS